MGIMDKYCVLLSSQIKQPSATLPTKGVDAHTIQDNDQSIKLGAIDEKNTKPVLRGTSPARTGRR